MLREENSAFSEEEVGGAWAQPHPPASTAPDAATFSNLSGPSAGPTASAAKQQQQQQQHHQQKSTHAPPASASTLTAPASTSNVVAGKKNSPQNENVATVKSSSSHVARSGAQSAEDSRESAFTPAAESVVGAAAAAAAHSRSTAEEGCSPSFLVRAGDNVASSSAYHDPPTCAALESESNNNALRTNLSGVRAYPTSYRDSISNNSLHQHPSLAHFSASVAAAAMQREAALDEELMDHEENTVLVRTSSQNSRSGNRSRGPPVAAVMNASSSALAGTGSRTNNNNNNDNNRNSNNSSMSRKADLPATTLMEILDTAEAEVVAPEPALFPPGMQRPVSQESISFSIHSSSSSARSSSSSSNTTAGAAAADAASVFPTQPLFTEDHSPLPSMSANHINNNNNVHISGSSGAEQANQSLTHASESMHSSPSSPAAVTLWGVHRDLRRKRIKKVSHYILGSLLGEGAYGVVRDCIDINTDNVNRRFQRCAIKIVNGSYAKADMPAIFGSRGTNGNNNNNNSGGGSGADSSSPSPDPDNAPLRGMLKRTTGGGGVGVNGMRYHREEEQRRQETFQREMRNLQRFHCKNIIRALDSFTRYSKEYVVLPIAICSVQQLVRQLMRTRWREAVKEWRKRQRKLQRKQQRAWKAAAAVAAGGSVDEHHAANQLGPSEEEVHRQQPQPQTFGRGLPLVPSAMDTLDFDDLTFMLDGESDYGDEESEEDEDELEDEDTTTATSTDVTHTAANNNNNTNNNGSGDREHGARLGAASRHVDAMGGGHEDDQRSCASLSDHDDDGANYRHHSTNNNKNTRNDKNVRGNASGFDSAAAAAEAGTRKGPSSPFYNTANAGNRNGTPPNHHRGLPRVSSTGSNTTTTTTTARTIDSYDNNNNNNNSGGGGHHYAHSRGVSRGQLRGGEDETSDLSSCGVNNSGNANCIHVMSATPTMQDGELVLGKPATTTTSVPQPSYDGEEERRGCPTTTTTTATATSAATANNNNTNNNNNNVHTTASKISSAASATAVPLAETSKINTAVYPPPLDDSRPHLTYPMCSTTLLKGIFYQVISGVNYLHQQNLAHNDIKPSNILLFEDGTVKLGDLGSVSEAYNDQGTPLYASPELCKYFYGAATPPSSFSQSTEVVGRDAAKPSDMWCCGLLLYYLITGKPGPLPVQVRYFQSLHSKHYHHHHHHAQPRSPTSSNRAKNNALRGGRGEATGAGPSETTAGGAEGGACNAQFSPPPPPPIVTRYQLYREIASQVTPVDLSGLPDMIPPDLGDDATANTLALNDEEDNSNNNNNNNNSNLHGESAPSPTVPYPKNSVRHLLAGLLELDPQRRLTAEQALRHPWLRMTFRLKPNDREESAAHHGHGHHSRSNNNNNNNNNNSTSQATQRDASRRGRKSSSPNPQSAEGDGVQGTSAGQVARKAPSKQAMEDAIQRDVARRVTESRHVRRMLMLDRQRHLQFVADCCNMLNLTIPPEIIKVQPAEPYREDIGGPMSVSGALVHGRLPGTPPASKHGLSINNNSNNSNGPATQQQRNAAAAAMAAAMLGGGGRNNPRVQSLQQQFRNNNNNHNSSSGGGGGGGANSAHDAVTGTVLQSAMLPAEMPPGCVDTELFLPHTEEDYYEQKSGKSEFDVRVLRRKPLLMAQLDEYFHNVVLVQCGYRTGPDPNYQAMRVRAVPMEDELGTSSSGRRRTNNNNSGGGSGGGGSSRGSTQQPSVVILPGASHNVYRRSPSVGVTQLSALEGGGGVLAGLPGTPTAGGASGGGEVLVEDVWGAGPRHQPRVHVDENGNVISAVPHYPSTGAATTTRPSTPPPGAATAASAAAGRVVGSTGSGSGSTNNNINNTNSREERGAANRSSAHGGPSAGSASNNTSNTRSSAANRPTVSVSASAANNNNNNANNNNRYNSVDSMASQEVMGTAVVNTARASVIHGSGQHNNRRGGRAGNNNNNGSGRSPRDGSESASEAEQNVAMRESSKCLCGLM